MPTAQSRFAQLLAVSFAGAILVGTVLLKLPWCAKDGLPLAWIDAAFTATSAVCVTGLSTIDISARLTPVGQAILMLLIQAGGLGIMTFSLFFLLLTGQRISLAQQWTVSDMTKTSGSRELFRSLFKVFVMTAAVEGAGAALLFLSFRSRFPLDRALFVSLFHAVSAFCNAGFALFSNSLEGFSADPWVPAVHAALIILGGLGFVVVNDLRHGICSLRSRAKRSWGLHTKMVLAMTAALLAAGTAIFFFFEFRNTLRDMPFALKIGNAFFLSATARTAGFNTLATGNLANGSLLILILWMFVGGAPGSAAGGVKVTTFSVLIALLVSEIRNLRGVQVFRRKIPDVVIGKALLITAAAVIVIAFVVLLLQFTESGKLHQPALLEKGMLLELLFETVSAFGTVGLSTGVTPLLSFAGKILIMITMFAGRVGPLTLAFLILAKRRTRRVEIEYVEEEILVG